MAIEFLSCVSSLYRVHDDKFIKSKRLMTAVVRQSLRTQARYNFPFIPCFNTLLFCMIPNFIEFNTNNFVSIYVDF